MIDEKKRVELEWNMSSLTLSLTLFPVPDAPKRQNEKRL